MSNYFYYLNEDILNIILSYLEYEELCSFIKSDLIEIKENNYRYLFYNEINEYQLNYKIIIDIVSYQLNSNNDNLFQILYFIVIKDHGYMEYLIEMDQIYDLDKDLFNLLKSNKNFVDFIEISYCDDTVIKLGISDISDWTEGINMNAFWIEPLIAICYYDNIKEITNYIIKYYNFEQISYFYEVLDDYFMIRYKKHVINYIEFLIEKHPIIIDLYISSYFPIYFVSNNLLNISYMALNKVFEHFLTNLLGLNIYIDNFLTTLIGLDIHINNLINDITDVDIHIYTIDDLNNLTKLLDFILNYINTTEDPLFDNTKLLIVKLISEFKQIGVSFLPFLRLEAEKEEIKIKSD